jgi:hypothetical protein
MMIIGLLVEANWEYKRQSIGGLLASLPRSLDRIEAMVGQAVAVGLIIQHANRRRGVDRVVCDIL